MESNPMEDETMLFRLKSRATLFRVVRYYKASGFIPAVYGETLDGKYCTCARVEDIDLVPDTELEAA